MEKAMLTRTIELKRRGKNIETPSPCVVALFTAEMSTLKSNCFGVELRACEQARPVLWSVIRSHRWCGDDAKLEQFTRMLRPEKSREYDSGSGGACRFFGSFRAPLAADHC